MKSQTLSFKRHVSPKKHLRGGQLDYKKEQHGHLSNFNTSKVLLFQELSAF